MEDLQRTSNEHGVNEQEEKDRDEKDTDGKGETPVDNKESYDKENCENEVKEDMAQKENTQNEEVEKEDKDKEKKEKEDQQKEEKEIVEKECSEKCAHNIEDLLGFKYVQVSHDKFDEYLKYMGYGYIMRTAALKLSPVHCLTRNADSTYTFTMHSLLASSSITFLPGEEFYENKPDGNTVKALVTFEENRMTHTQTELNGRTSRHVRELYQHQMIVKTSVDGWHQLAIRYYDLYQK